MGYDCNHEIRTATGELFSAKEETKLEASMTSRETLQDVLCDNLLIDDMIAVLALNGVNCSRLKIEKNSIDMALLIADAMLEGVAANCPVCEEAGLCWCAGRVTCWGYLGSVQCVFKAKAEDVQRFNFQMQRRFLEQDWMQEWIHNTRQPSS